MKLKPPAPRPGDTVFDQHGKITALAAAKGYVMVRRPQATPFTLSVARWNEIARNAKKAGD